MKSISRLKLFQLFFLVFLIYPFNTSSIGAPVIEKTIKQYAQECSRKLGDSIPDFDCLEDGVNIPIYFKEAEVDENSEIENCDNPTLIHNVKAPCATGSRLGVMRNEGSKVISVFICRKYKHRPNINRYDDIAIIQHNEKTGATCWYQSGEMSNGGIDSKIKSPLKSDMVNESNTIKWETPKEFESNKCVACHTSDPFIHTPYLRKTLKKELYKIGHNTIDSPYYFPPYYFPVNKQWNNLKHIHFKSPTPGSFCTKCHRIALNPNGTGDCEKYLNDSVGLDDPSSKHSRKDMRWMPPLSHKKTPEELKIIMDDIKNCCQNPNLVHCEAIPISGKK